MTRDPARINRMINKLRRLWHKHPDLRLGQLVTGMGLRVREDADPFYVEDDEMEAKIDDWMGTDGEA